MMDQTNQEIQKREAHLDAIRGSMIGGAIGDALGYEVEFSHESEIFRRFGPRGIQMYAIKHPGEKARISDDTQMSMFTAAGLLFGDTRGSMRGIRGEPRSYVAMAYQDWLLTQEMTYTEAQKERQDGKRRTVSWLLDVPELYARRAPGNTCLSALRSAQLISDYIARPCNTSKGCGGVMRVAPLGLSYGDLGIEEVDREAAQLAAITHGNSLGYLPAAVLVHIIHRIVFPREELTLKQIVEEARDTVRKLFPEDSNMDALCRIINLAIALSENKKDDLDNIHALGEGWVAEETLAIAIYCSLKYQNDFDRAITVSVNHNGDSDSTGAVTGNIVGALLGYAAIDEKWKKDLELIDVILELSDDLCRGCRMSEYSSCCDPAWESKYIYRRRFVPEQKE